MAVVVRRGAGAQLRRSRRGARGRAGQQRAPRPLHAEAAESESESESPDGEEAQREDPGPSEPEEDNRPRHEVLLEELRAGLAEGERDMLTLEEVRKQLEDEAASLASRAEQAESLASGLEAELAGAKETSKRLSADFENFKRRAQSEKEQLSLTERSKVMERLLPVVDDFERARTSVQPESDGEQKIANGYQAIYSQLVSIFQELGLKQIDTVGQPFDPEIHEAVMRSHSDDFAEDVVMEELRKGFTVNDSLLRPAMVKVSQGPETPEPESSPDNGSDRSASADETAESS